MVPSLELETKARARRINSDVSSPLFLLLSSPSLFSSSPLRDTSFCHVAPRLATNVIPCICNFAPHTIHASRPLRCLSHFSLVAIIVDTASANCFYEGGHFRDEWLFRKTADAEGSTYKLLCHELCIGRTEFSMKWQQFLVQYIWKINIAYNITT